MSEIKLKGLFNKKNEINKQKKKIYREAIK
jgi:hypothetical protein